MIKSVEEIQSKIAYGIRMRIAEKLDEGLDHETIRDLAGIKPRDYNKIRDHVQFAKTSLDKLLSMALALEMRIEMSFS